MKIEFDDDAGIGIVILAFGVGYIFGAAWGWATFGLAVIVTSIKITTGRGGAK